MELFSIIILFITFRNIYLIKKMKNKKNRVFSIKDIESINLGSSHSECVFKHKDKNLNLALVFQTFYYDLLLLKEYLKK